MLLLFSYNSCTVRILALCRYRQERLAAERAAGRLRHSDRPVGDVHERRRGGGGARLPVRLRLGGVDVRVAAECGRPAGGGGGALRGQCAQGLRDEHRDPPHLCVLGALLRRAPRRALRARRAPRRRLLVPLFGGRARPARLRAPLALRHGRRPAHQKMTCTARRARATLAAMCY